jgi:signal transduction histidine kinase
MAARSPSDPRAPDRSVRRAVVALAVGAIVAFGFVVVGSTFLAKQIARDEELAEAVRTDTDLVGTVLAGTIQSLVDGDPKASAALDEAIRIRRSNGSTVHLTILAEDGEVLYPGGHGAAGQLSFPQTADLSARTSAMLITAEQGRAEIGAAATGRMVRVDMPVQLPSGTPVRALVYATDERLRTSESALSAKLVMLSTGAVTLLLLLNLPVSVWLLRRVDKAHRERARLLANEVVSADRERRNIARDLHDGVIQDLAGAGYALEALTDGLHVDNAARRMLSLSQDAVRRSTQALRTMIIEVAPPDLTSQDLPTAIDVLAKRLSKEHPVDVHVEVDLRVPVGRQEAIIVYRAVREFLTNVVKHARATHALVTVRSDASNVYVFVEDDGDGFPADMAERRANGHLGLTLLADTIADLGGRLTIDRHRDRGAAVRCRIPIGQPD